MIVFLTPDHYSTVSNLIFSIYLHAHCFFKSNSDRPVSIDIWVYAYFSLLLWGCWWCCGHGTHIYTESQTQWLWTRSIHTECRLSWAQRLSHYYWVQATPYSARYVRPCARRASPRGATFGHPSSLVWVSSEQAGGTNLRKERKINKTSKGCFYDHHFGIKCIVDNQSN